MLIINQNRVFIILLTVVLSSWINSGYAYECVVDTDGDGIGDGTAGASSGAVIKAPTRLACGMNTRASGDYSNAIGAFSIASGFDSNAFGRGALALTSNATSIGSFSSARSVGATSLGYSAKIDKGDSPGAIAIGAASVVAASSPGAIAIGGDTPIPIGPYRGAEASGAHSIAIGAQASALQPGAIAIGAFVVANKPNTMQVGVPIHIERGDGTSQLRITETSAGTNVRTLMSLICDTCTPGFRFHRLLPNNQTWFFRMLQNGDFSMDDPLTVTKEAQFKSGGDLVIGGTLVQASSREIKTNFTELNSAEILEKLDELPIKRWSYKKDEGKINHIGPMSEDFYSLFNVGLNSKGLSSVDTAGVALAAIKALKQENDELKMQDNALVQLVQEKDTQIAQLQYQIDDLKEILQSIIMQNQHEQIAGGPGNQLSAF